MPKYKRTFKGVKKKPKKKKIKLYKPKNLTKMFSKLKFKKPRRKPRKSKKIQKPKFSKPKFSKQRPMITLRQKPKKKLLLNVYPIQSPLSIKPESHYQSFSYSDAQSSSYATGQKPQFKRKAQKEIDIDGHKEGQLLMQNNDRGIVIDY